MDSIDMAKEQVTPKKANWLKRIGIIAFICGALIIALPFAIQYGIVKGLTEAGSEEVTLKDVDFNPFTGELAIHSLHVKKQQEVVLSVPALKLQVDWLPLFSKQVLISSLSIKDSILKIEQPKPNSLYIAGLNIPLGGDNTNDDSDAPTTPTWGVGLKKLRLINNDFIYTSPDFSDEITIQDFSIDKAISWNPEGASDFSFDFQFNKATIAGDISVSIFAEKPLVKGQLRISKLNLHDFHSLLKEQVNQLEGFVSTDIKFSAAVDNEDISVEQSGSVSISQLAIATDTLNNSLAQAQWNGASTFKQKDGEQSLVVNGDLALNDIKSDNPLKKLTVASIKKLAINKLAINQLNDIKVAAVNITGLSLATDSAKKTLLKSKGITVSDIQVTNSKDISINSIGINTLTANINVNKKDEIPLLQKLMASLATDDTNEAPKKAEVTTKEAPAAFQLAKLNISKNSVIHFSKQTSKGKIKKDIRIKDIRLGALSTLKPNKATPININATIDKHSTLAVKGSIYPFSKKTNLALKTKLAAFELPEFSPIIREQLGYNIQQGQLNADININIKNNMLKGETDIAINQLKLEAADEAKMAKMSKQLAMPLDSALSLLRDGNDDIKLSVPIKGNIDSPDFNINDIINTALGNALKGSVTNLLKYALQPYGLIYMAAEKAYGVATAIKLDAITFLPGNSVLSADSATYLKRIGGLMQKSPQLRIRVCGFSTSEDNLLPEQAQDQGEEAKVISQEALLKLAKDRAAAVKSHLISSYKIDAARLFNCNPKTEAATAENKPRVELLI